MGLVLSKVSKYLIRKLICLNESLLCTKESYIISRREVYTLGLIGDDFKIFLRIEGWISIGVICIFPKDNKINNFFLLEYVPVFVSLRCL